MTTTLNADSTGSRGYVPTRRQFGHASTFTAGDLPLNAGGLKHTTAAPGSSFALEARLAQQRSELQNTARQVRLSVSKGYCTSTPLHTRASSFASTVAPSSDHPDVDLPSSRQSVVSASSYASTNQGLGTSRFSRTQSAPVASLSSPRDSASAYHGFSQISALPSKPNELEPYGSRPQRPWEPSLSSDSAFGSLSSGYGRQTAVRFEEGDVTAISIVPSSIGKEEDPDSVLGAHFEADEAFDAPIHHLGFGIAREDRHPSSSDEEDGGSSSQSEAEDGEPKSRSGSASPRRFPLTSRPNGLANKTTSLPAGPFDAAAGIDETFARRSILRHGLESRTRSVAPSATMPTVKEAQAQPPAEKDLPPWTPRDFERWASSQDF
ncbi:hypothetical protein OC861_002702 [Tilletia horrida]|nr:hypothetical protein OC861_002702 [Tilletia horrida]